MVRNLSKLFGRKFASNAFIVLFSLATMAVVPPNSVADIPSFDGTYSGTITITTTTTIPTDPPQTSSKTDSNELTLVVTNGVIEGGAKGSILDSAGNATMLFPYGGANDLAVVARFRRDVNTGALSVSGVLNWNFPSAQIVVVGEFALKAIEKFTFKVPAKLPSAKIGKRYQSGVSLCSPMPPPKHLCGVFAKISNPNGGREPYTFGLKIGSDFLPSGMILNANTGVISGTPKVGQKPGTRHLILCSYDANDRFTGICRSTTLTLTR